MRPTALLVVAMAVVLAARATLRRLDVVQVRGRSMEPTLRHGDRLLVVRRSARIGDIVLAADPREPEREIVKRVVGRGPGGLVLRGDNPAFSTDSRIFGTVPPSSAHWRVLLRYWPPPRAGRPGSAPPAAEPPDEGGEMACTVPSALIAGDRSG